MKHSNNPALYLLVRTNRFPKFPNVDDIPVASEPMSRDEAIEQLAEQVREREYFPYTDHTAKVISQTEYDRLTGGAE